MDCRIKSGNDGVGAIARSASDEAIQGPLALSAGLLRHSPSKTGVNALMLAMTTCNLVLAMQLHRRVVTRGNDRPESRPRFFCFPDNEGSGAPNGAGVENCTRYQVQPRSLAGSLTFRCSTAV